jgi:hypothetical protein
MHGFFVYFTASIADDQAFFDILELDLLEIIKIIPSHVVEILKTVRIYTNKTYFYNGKPVHGACCHWSKEWLRQNGNLPEKESHVEVYNIEDYKNWIKEQPSMLFHEMVHAYQWREGARINEFVTEVYEKVMKKGIYDKVKYIYG